MKTAPRKKIKHVVWAAVAVALVLGATFYISYRARENSAIRRLEASARARGEPLTLAELEAMQPRIPDDENAAVALLEVWEQEHPVFWRAFREGKRPLPQEAYPAYDPDLPLLGSNRRRPEQVFPLTDSSRAATQAHIREIAEHLNAVRTALKRSGSRFPVRYAEGLDALLPHLSQIKMEAQHFCIEALLAVDRADVDAAILALGDAARVGSLVSNEPFLLSQYVRISCLTLTLNRISEILSRQPLLPKQLDRLESLVAQMRMSGAARRAFIGERALMLGMFEVSKSNPLPVQADALTGEESNWRDFRKEMKVFRFLGIADADHRFMLEKTEEMIQLAAQETPEALAQLTAVGPRIAMMSGFPFRPLSRLFLAPLPYAAEKFARLETLRRAAVAAIGIERFRLAHGGALPESLDVVVPQFLPKVPTDPFDGQPLRFRRMFAGYVLYSVGADLVDDAGRIATSGTTKSPDVSFFVER